MKALEVEEEEEKAEEIKLREEQPSDEQKALEQPPKISEAQFIQPIVEEIPQPAATEKAPAVKQAQNKE